MAETFLSLSSEERREALEIAASRSGRPTHLLEKDVWVVFALGALFESAMGDRLVFKGGTSLSKAYRAIRRFSEDVDLTYDVRALAPPTLGVTPGQQPRQHKVRLVGPGCPRLPGNLRPGGGAP